MPDVPTTGPTGHQEPEGSAGSRSGGVRWREVAAFGMLGLACCAAYVLILVILGIESRNLALLGMLTPAIAAFLVVWRRPDRRRGFGSIARITSIWPPRPVGRTVAWCLVGMFLTAGAVVPVVAFGAITGMQELDLRNFSMLRADMAQTFDGVAADGSGFPALLPFLLWVLLQLTRPFVLLLLAFGEELGWRGYLLPTLMPLGIGRMLLVSLLFWVGWHVPLSVLGQEYEGVGDVLGWTAMFVFGQALPQLLVISWLRLASRSVWPAVLMHASSSLAFMVITIVSEAGTPVAGVAVDIGGQQLQLINLALGVIGVLLLATGQMRVRPDDPAIPGPSGPSGPGGPDGPGGPASPGEAGDGGSYAGRATSDRGVTRRR